MADKLDNSAPFDDDQGTRISGEPTGAGTEPARGTDGEGKSGDHENESSYRGKAGQPKEPEDIPTSRR